MKATFAVLAIGATVAVAQDLSSLPQCGQTCINNMIDIAKNEFKCKDNDILCYCTNVNFGYGVRDCSQESCPSKSDADKVIAFGTAFCQNYLASAGPSASGALSTGAVVPLSSALATASDASELLSSASGAIASGAQSTAITTSTHVATVVSGDQTHLQTSLLTIYSALSGATDSAGSVIASATDSAGSVIASATDSAGSVIASATDSAGSAIASATDSAGSAIASATESAASAASSVAASVSGALSSAASAATGASTGGAAPMMTGAPFAGAIGMAALFLL